MNFYKTLLKKKYTFDVGPLLDESLKHPDFLEFLYWELGFDKVRPFLKEVPSIEEIRKYTSLKGTEEALNIALKWLSLERTRIELREPGVHFSDVTLKLPKNINTKEAFRLKKVFDFSVSSRDRLYRIYRGMDIRFHRLGESFLGNSLIAADSGVSIDGIKQSFREYHVFFGQIEARSMLMSSGNHHKIFCSSKLDIKGVSIHKTHTTEKAKNILTHLNTAGFIQIKAFSAQSYHRHEKAYWRQMEWGARKLLFVRKEEK